MLASLGLSESLTDRFGANQPDSYAPTNDRRVVGSMLDYRKMFQMMMAYNRGPSGADIAAINAKLNDSPMSVIAMDSAVRRVRMLAESSRLLH